MIDRKLVPAVSFLEGVAVTLSGRAWPALVAALSVVIVALALIPGVALARYCGTIRVSGVSDPQNIQARGVGCHTAKTVIRAYLRTGHASGWRCHGSAGVAQCTRGSSRVKSAATDFD